MSSTRRGGSFREPAGRGVQVALTASATWRSAGPETGASRNPPKDADTRDLTIERSVESQVAPAACATWPVAEVRTAAPGAFGRPQPRHGHARARAGQRAAMLSV